MEHRFRKKLLFVLGTRPEVIKTAPVIRCARAHGPDLEAVVCLTAQHRDLVDPLLRYFEVGADHDLDLMIDDQSLFHVASRALTLLDDVFRRERPDIVVVQGDTTTTFAVGLAAFYHRIPVAHVEAGLRTFSRYEPFPEEKHRQLTSVLAAYHYAPTETARQNLIAENVDPETIIVTGNPVIDALRFVLEKGPEGREVAGLLEDVGGDRVVLATAHRRESFGGPLEQICEAIARLVSIDPGVRIIFPVHPNPRVRETVGSILGDCEAVSLIDPLAYPDFVHLMRRADLILTDSGGIQEEACFLGKRVLLMRDITERPEAIDAGYVTVAGRREDDIVEHASRLLSGSMNTPNGKRDVYGDGRASERIIDHVLGLFEIPSPGEGSLLGGSREKTLHF